MVFEKAVPADLDGVGVLYDAVCEYLEAHVNYPHWKKGVYPTRADAQESLGSGTLYVCRDGGALIGAMCLSHVPEAGYAGVCWDTPDTYDRITVLYTLAVRPDRMQKGVGRFMMAAAERLARAEGCIAVRLDAVTGNLPARALYERCGYRFVTAKSLGYEKSGIPLYDLFEKIL